MVLYEQHYFKLLFFLLPIGEKDDIVKSGMDCVVGVGDGLRIKQIANAFLDSLRNALPDLWSAWQ